MTYISGILEVSEGPVTENMKAVFAELLVETEAADAA